MKITKNNVDHGAFRECIWSNRSGEDLDARKRRLAQTVWEEQFRDSGLFLGILYFHRYLPGFCAPRLARYKKVYKADIPAVVGGAGRRSGEVEIASSDAEIVFAVNAVSPCTLENFLAVDALTARTRGMRVLIRAEKYRREHGEFPKTLADLPLDPFTGKPLVYEVGKTEVLETVWKKTVSADADEVKVVVDAVSVRSPAEKLSELIRDPQRGTDNTRAMVRY